MTTLPWNVTREMRKRSRPSSFVSAVITTENVGRKVKPWPGHWDDTGFQMWRKDLMPTLMLAMGGMSANILTKPY